ncbi:MAG: 50S ribosomal protein L3, partial [Limisphaerales bacterium]
DMSHGSKGWHRRPGAIGQRSFPGTVQRGMKMPGHMGQVRRTVQNLEVVKVLEDENILLIKGSMPGAEGDYVIIRESKKKPKGTPKKKAPQPGKAAKAKTAAKK